MTKREILKVSKQYTEFFKENKEISRMKHMEYYDFVHLHIEGKSYLAFECDNLKSQNEYVEHSESISKIIYDNDSKINREKTNFLSRLKNAELIGILLTSITLLCSLSYYFGTEKTNSEYINNLIELNKIKDLSIQKTTKFSDTIANKKGNIEDKKENQRK